MEDKNRDYVYVLVETETYEGSEIRGVFFDLERAIAAARHIHGNNSWDNSLYIYRCEPGVVLTGSNYHHTSWSWCLMSNEKVRKEYRYDP